VKLSVKVEYACRVLAQLARNFESESLAHIESLAKAEAVSANYLAQILGDLRNGGLIISRRGKFGGYALARRPDSITLYDILKVMDPEMIEFQIGREGASGRRVSEVWAEVQAGFVAALKKQTVEMMAEDEQKEMYHI